MDEEDENRDPDPRFNFILQDLLDHNKLKIDLWQAMKDNNAYVRLIQHFFNTPTENMLLIELSPLGMLIPHSFVQVNFKCKYHYYLRREVVSITKENYAEVLIAGEMYPKNFDELTTIIDEVFLPVLTTPSKGDAWPEVVTDDVRKHAYELRSMMCQTRSKISGDTMLPMPMGIEQIFGRTLRVAPQLRRDIEEIVIKWTDQITEVLAEDSSNVFNKDEIPLPKNEFTFWKKRLKNVENIYDQLKDPRVKRMALVLERSKSSYLTGLQKIFKDVVGAVIEARDVCLYLLPLEKYCQEIESQPYFPDIQKSLNPMMHCICLTWSRSKYYCSSTRIVTLFNEISNLLIIMCSDYLDPNSLFQGEIEEGLKRLDLGIEVIEYYQKVFNVYRGKVTNYFRHSREPVGWTFHEKMIFDRLLKFLERAKQIKSRHSSRHSLLNSFV